MADESVGTMEGEESLPRDADADVDGEVASTQPDSVTMSPTEEAESIGARRSELEVMDVNLSGRAQRRLARHARRARIPLVARALVVDEFVDVDEVTNEVHDAEPEGSLMDVSSDEGDVVATGGRLGRRNLGGAALSVNFGRLVRLPKRKAAPKRRPTSAPARSSARAGADATAPGLPMMEEERVGDNGWGAAGFEAQPSSSSSAPVESRFNLPEVPLTPDRDSGDDHGNDTLPESWFQVPEDDVVAPPSLGESAASNGFSCIYVEPVRPGLEPRTCGQCHSFFNMGDLRLGYTPCGVAADGRQFLPVWVHAFVCARRAKLAIRFDGESISFSPAVSQADQNRLVEELRQLHQSLTRQRSQPRQLCIRPWRYFPSLLQRWPVTQLREDMPRRPSEPHDRPSWRLPSPGEVWQGEDVPEESLGARHVQEVLAQLVSESRTWPERPLVPPMVPNFMAAQVVEPPPLAEPAHNSSALLTEVPTFQAEAKSQEPCVVCRDDIHVGQVCRRLPCLHLFHKECIDQWIAVKATCPLDNLKLEVMLRRQHSLEIGEEPAATSARSRSRSPRSPRSPRYRSPRPPPQAFQDHPWDARSARFRRSRWDHLSQNDFGGEIAHMGTSQVGSSFRHRPSQWNVRPGSAPVPEWYNWAPMPPSMMQNHGTGPTNAMAPAPPPPPRHPPPPVPPPPIMPVVRPLLHNMPMPSMPAMARMPTPVSTSMPTGVPGMPAGMPQTPGMPSMPGMTSNTPSPARPTMSTYPTFELP